MLIRLLMLMIIALPVATTNTITSHAQNPVPGNENHTGPLQLYSVTIDSNETFGNGRTEITWQFDFNSINVISGPNAILRTGSITADLFEYDDADIEAATIWRRVQTPDLPQGVSGLIKVGGTSGTDMEFRSRFWITATTFPGPHGTMRPRFKDIASFPNGRAVMTCESEGSVVCNKLVAVSNDDVFEPTVPATSFTRTSVTALDVTRHQSNNPTDNTQAAVGDEVVWFLDFTGTAATTLSTISSSIEAPASSGPITLSPPPPADPVVSRQFEIRALMADGTTADPAIPTIPVIVTRIGTDPAGRYRATGTIATASQSASLTYGLFTRSSGYSSIRNEQNVEVVFIASPSNAPGSDSPHSTLQPNRQLSVNAAPGSATLDAAKRYAHIPTTTPTLAITKVSTVADPAPAGTALAWQFAFSDLNFSSLTSNTDGTSNQFEVCYDPDGFTPSRLALTFSGSGNTVTATSAATPANPNTFNYHICTLPAAVNVRSSTGGNVNFSATESTHNNIGDEITTTTNNFRHLSPPSIQSIVRTNSAPSATLGGEISWTIRFNEIVTGVDRLDFAVTNAPNGTTVAVTPSTDSIEYTVTATLPNTPVLTDTDILLALSGTNATTLGISLVSDNNSIFTPSSRVISGSDEAKYVLNTGSITATFGTPIINTNGASKSIYSVSFPINFSVPVTLDSNAHAGLFSITDGTTPITNIIIQSNEPGVDPIRTGIRDYLITGIIPNGVTGSVTYTASFTVINTSPVIFATTDSSNRVSITSVSSGSSPSITIPANTDVTLESIALNPSTLPAVGETGAIEYIVTFSHPVSGITHEHFTISANSGFTGTAPTIDNTIDDPTSNPPTFAAVRGTTIDGGRCYAFGDTSDPTLDPTGAPTPTPSPDASSQTEFCNKWIVPTTSVTRTANSTLTITADINSTEAGNITPLGSFAAIRPNETLSFSGALSTDAQPPVIVAVLRADRDGNVTIPPPPRRPPPDGVDPSLPFIPPPVQPTATSGGDVSWRVIFNEPVEGVDATDFAATLGDNIRVESVPASPFIPARRESDGTPVPPVPPVIAGTAYTITASLPTTGITTDTEIRLSLSSTIPTTLAITDSANNRFAPPRAEISGGSIYLLNNDDGEVVMTVTTIGDPIKGQVFAGNDIFDLWQLDFDEPVVGVDTTGETTQFSIQIGEEVPGQTSDGDTIDPRTGIQRPGVPVPGRFLIQPNQSFDGFLEIYVTERTPGRSYIVRARLPKAGYPSGINIPTFTSANLRTSIDFGDIVSASSAASGISRGGAILTPANSPDTSELTPRGSGYFNNLELNSAITGRDFNDIKFNTGTLTVDDMTSIKGNHEQGGTILAHFWHASIECNPFEF